MVRKMRNSITYGDLFSTTANHPPSISGTFQEDLHAIPCHTVALSTGTTTFSGISFGT